MITENLPYRLNVGILLLNKNNTVFVARRKDRFKNENFTRAWQLPQGGIDEGETPEQALFREMLEEIGTDKAAILREYPGWLDYDLPQQLVGSFWGGRYRGQRQKWFALRFEGTEKDIKLDTGTHAEFDACQWVSLEQLPELAVSFKRPVYQKLVEEFQDLVK